MKTVKVTLSAAQQDDVSAAPGETLTDKLRWIVGYWGAVLEQHRARVAKEQADKAKPAQLALVRDTLDDVADDMASGSEVATARVLVDAAQMLPAGANVTSVTPIDGVGHVVEYEAPR
jgi:hypothetical protein